MTLHHDPLGDGISNLSLIDAMGNDASVVRAARVSLALDQTPMDAERDAKLIRYLLRHGHWSCFEHCVLTVRVAAPLPVVRQWQRHTSWRFNEVSRRYTSEGVQVYEPATWRGQGATNRQASAGLCMDPARARDIYHDTVVAAQHAYTHLLGLGVARELARLVLPQAMYVAMYATASLRSALHFIGLRADEAAQGEMQAFAVALGAIVADRWPVTWAAWQALREAT